MVAYYTNRPVTIALKKLTKVAVNRIFSPCLATRFPFSSFNPFIAPEMIPIEEKLAKETKNTEMIAELEVAFC